MNGTVELSFKEKVAKYGTCGSAEQCTGSTGKKVFARKCTKRASQTEVMTITLVFFSRVQEISL